MSTVLSKKKCKEFPCDPELWDSLMQPQCTRDAVTQQTFVVVIVRAYTVKIMCFIFS